MPRFFGYDFNWPGIRGPWTSSTGSRNAVRGNAFAQVIGALDNPVTIIPAKFAQAGISAYTLFRSDVHLSERVIHALEGAIAASELVLAVIFLYQDEACLEVSSSLCKSALMLQYFYTGVLTVQGAVSEMSKDPYTNARNENADIPGASV